METWLRDLKFMVSLINDNNSASRSKKLTTIAPEWCPRIIALLRSFQ